MYLEVEKLKYVEKMMMRNEMEHEGMKFGLCLAFEMKLSILYDQI